MRNRIARAVALLLATFAPAAVTASMRAEQITAESAPDLLIGGPEAIGGVGDWYLANGRVEVIVDDVSRRFAKLNHGGTIVDAGLLDRENEDQMARLFPIVNLDQRVFIDFDSINASVDEEEGWARLVVTNSGRMNSVPRDTGWTRWFDPLVPTSQELQHVAVETEYTVFRGEPFVHITTTFRNEGPHPAPIISYGDVWMRGGRSGRSWVGNTLNPDRASGFHHLSFDRRNILAAGEAMAAFTHLSVPGMPDVSEIGYALFAPERTARGLRQFGVTGEHVTLFNAFVGDPDWDAVGLVRLALATRSEIAPGASWSFRRRLLITDHADVASTTDVIFPLLDYADGSSGIEGKVLPVDERHVIHVSDASTGAPVTEISPPTHGPRSGSFRATLPPGAYRLEVRAEHRAPRGFDVEVGPESFAAVGEIELPPPGWLILSPAFSDAGPGRVIVEGEGGTPDPVFGAELLDFRVDGKVAPSGTEINEVHFVGNASDPTRIAIPPGRYRLTATRGFEYTAATREVEVPGPGSEVRVLPFALSRVVRIPGALSGDLHVHAQASDDSGMSNAARLRSFLAADIDVLVTTDHDHLGFFEPALDALGVRDRIRVIQGVEVTSSAPSPAAAWTIGHHNAWPIAYDSYAHRQGAPPSQNMTVADLYATLRSDFGARVIQLNHPRTGTAGDVAEGNFLTHLGSVGVGFDPTKPLESAPNDRLLAPASNGSTRAIDFDAIELMNAASFRKFLQVRKDWYALLRQGFVRTATANSDSHGPDQPAGYPRNYVFARDEGEPWDADRFIESVRRGRSFGTNGPLIVRFTANGGTSGDQVAAPGGDVNVDVEIAAAPWVPVDEVRLLVNGDVIRRFDTTGTHDGAVIRLDERFGIELESDAFITLEAGVPLDVDARAWRRQRGGLYAKTVARGFLPTAFANPILVDVNGNGRFDPPGLVPSVDGGESPGAFVVAAISLLLAATWIRRRRRFSASHAPES